MLLKIFGLSLIAAVISCTAVRLANGGTPAGPLQANPASAQASEAPRIENAKLETRAVGASLETTIRELAARAEQPEWVGYSVDEIAGEHGVCCNNSWNDGNCGTCRLRRRTAELAARRTQTETLNWKANGNSSCSTASRVSASLKFE